MVSRVPIITERLRIRAFSMENAQDLYEYLADPQIYQNEPGEPINLDQAYTLAHDMSISEHFWAVDLKSDQKVIGQLYFSQ